jgi:hypothetical protein
MVTTSALANSLEGHVTLYSDAPVPWRMDENREVGELMPGLTATVLATHHDDGLSVYIMGTGIMGWALSAYLQRVVDNPVPQELG